jgi:hypothetical protein
MTRSHKKKKSKAQAPPADPSVDQENVKDTGTSKTSKAPPKQGASQDSRSPFKHKKPSVAPKNQVGLLVTNELAKAMEECRTKVAQIVKGCRAANRRFRYVMIIYFLLTSIPVFTKHYSSEMPNSTSRTTKFVVLKALGMASWGFHPLFYASRRSSKNLSSSLMVLMPSISFKELLAIAGCYLHSRPCPLPRV